MVFPTRSGVEPYATSCGGVFQGLDNCYSPKTTILSDGVFGMNAFLASLRIARNYRDKMLWGARVVGVGAAAKGAARMGYLYIRRPSRSEIQLRSGQVIEFDFPSQVPRVLLAFGDFIDPEFAFLRKISHPGWVVADVGAAIGQFSLFAATLPVAKVHAFEPNPENAAALSRNVVRNRLSSRVDVHRIAFSNAEFEGNFDTANAWTSVISETGSQRVSVRTLAADFERRRLEHVSVLKVNVAGYEPQVIEGAEPFLAKGGADILILLLGLASLRWYARLAAHGYRFFYFHPNENVLYEVTSFDADSVLAHRPWPARSIIAIHQSAIESRLNIELPVRRI